ncbi:MAG: nucleotidyltransferase family protein [Deltaproteobacteria bacterium]|nr:MAG: nucleotidyltransferase family protein [Deltaproteobacteria bacterium]
MKAMILAAGLGTRLRPLTLERPKALVPVGNIPVIDRIIEYLKGHGIREIIVNAHHHPGQIIRHLDGGRPFGVSIEVRVEPEILGTGGGIRNTADFWDDAPFVVINGDVLTDIDLRKVHEDHRRSRALATLVLHDRPPYNQVRVDGNGNIRDIAGSEGPGRVAFTGIHVISPALLDHIPARGFSSIIDCYRERIRCGMSIRGYRCEGHHWRDIGTPRSYRLANRECLGDDPFRIGPGCRVHPSARLADWAVVGKGAVLEPGAVVARSVLWEDVRVREGVKITDSVVTAGTTVTGDTAGAVL